MDKRTRPKKQKREPLSVERILGAAEKLIERDGLPALSMRGLGAELGVEAMSLYHHFPSKAHLCDALLDRLLLTIEPPDPALPIRERIRAAVHAFRNAVRARPSFALFALTHRLNTKVALAYIESMSALFLEVGHSTEETARMFRAFGYYMSGAVLDETSGYSRGPTAAEPVPMQEQAEIAPNLIRMGPYFESSHWDETFDFGLELLLKAIDEPKKKSKR